MLKTFQFVFFSVCVLVLISGCGSATRESGQVDPNETSPPDTTTDVEPVDMANGSDGNPIGSESADDAVVGDPLNP